ncbi:MAG: glycosyltransferase [Gammaproteobacteria bacterium]|nr:glycosyltransferase [Gammaproteobacteria bacterium]
MVNSEPSTSREPQVLFVSQQCPWPKNSGGNIRTYFIARYLAQVAAVTLLTTAPREGGAQAEAELEKFCAKVEFVNDEKGNSALANAATLAKSFLRRRPAFIEHNLMRGLNRAVQRCLATERYDALHVNQVDTFLYFADLHLTGGTADEKKVSIVLDTHNIHAEYYRRRARAASNPVTRALFARDGRLLADFELNAFRSSDKVIVCSPDEQQAVQAMDDTLAKDESVNVVVVPNGVDCEEYYPSPDDPFDRPHELVFMGDMAYAPNSEGVAGFIRNVLPRVRQHYPDTHFTVIGKAPPSALLKLVERRSDVTVTGFVDEMMPYMHRAKVFVIPLQYGAGTRLKVPQAFACGIPTVSTTIGAEGIDYTVGSDILIADSDEAMADAICTLFADRELYRTLRTRGRETALSKYDWRVIGQLVVEQYIELLGLKR